MKSIATAALFIASGTRADSECPGSKAFLTHAKTKLNVSFENACSDVSKTIQSRANGSQNGEWTDPHNKGIYTVDSASSSRIELHRDTGDGKYTDKMIFTLSESDGKCQVTACSESQVTSIKDFSTNYCNLHDLYCSDAGCNDPSSTLDYTENIVENSSGQHSQSDCYKVSAPANLLFAAQDQTTLYEIKDGTCGQTSLDSKYAPYAEKFDSSLKEGTCASQGYTVPAGSESHSVPILGKITIEKFTKPNLVSLNADAFLRGSDNKCKTVDTQENFDFDSYISKRWYIQQQMATKYLPESQNYCVYAEYSKMEKKSFWGYSTQVHNYAQEADGTKHDSKKIICAVKDSDFNDDARLRVGLCALPRINGVTTGPYWIVAYDEAKGYALVSGGQPNIPTSNGMCKTGSGVNNSGLWIFTREQQRNDDLVNEVRAIAESKGFDLSVLKDVDQSNC